MKMLMPSNVVRAVKQYRYGQPLFSAMWSKAARCDDFADVQLAPGGYIVITQTEALFRRRHSGRSTR